MLGLMCQVLTLVIGVCSSIGSAFHNPTYTFQDTQQLEYDLFHSYSQFLRPIDNGSYTTSVDVEVSLSSIVDLDEVNQKLVFSATLFIFWEDRALSWDMNNYDGLHYFSYSQDYLWKPDLTVFNSVVEMKGLGSSDTLVFINADGTIAWSPFGVFSTACDIDITYFPFDTQHCDIILSTQVSTSDEIRLNEDVTMLSSYSQSATWELVSVHTKSGSVQPQRRWAARSAIYVTLELKRRSTYYVLTLIVPVFFLAFTATLVNSLPSESGEKMGMSITVLLAFAVYLSIISDQMPKTSMSVSLLAVYLNIVLGQTAIGVIVSVWILNMHFRDETTSPIGPNTRAVTRFLQTLMCKGRKGSPSLVLKSKSKVSMVAPAPVDHTLSGDPTPTKVHSRCPPTLFMDMDTEPELTWKEVSQTIDRFLFRVLTLLLLVLSVAFIVVLMA